MGAVLIEQKKEKEKMNDWPPEGGPALVEQKKKKKKRNPQNGGDAHWAKERKRKNKQLGASACWVKEKRKEKTPPKWGWCSLSEWKKKKNERLAPKMGASTCQVKEKRKKKNTSQMGVVLVEQMKEKEKQMTGLQNGGQCLLSEREKNKKNNPQMGVVLVKWKKGEKKKEKKRGWPSRPSQWMRMGGWGYTNTTLLEQKFHPVVNIIRIKQTKKIKNKPLEVSRGTSSGSHFILASMHHRGLSVDELVGNNKEVSWLTYLAFFEPLCPPFPTGLSLSLTFSFIFFVHLAVASMAEGALFRVLEAILGAREVGCWWELWVWGMVDAGSGSWWWQTVINGVWCNKTVWSIDRAYVHLQKIIQTNGLLVKVYHYALH